MPVEPLKRMEMRTWDAGVLDLAPDPVRDFYTHHPYPPPVTNLDRARDEWRGEGRQRAEYHLVWPDRGYRTDLDILVAGCGTWQAAKYALCRPGSHVVGIDVSTTSLSHTEQLKRQYGLTNLDVRQLAIEDAASLDRQFDFIVCTGVLHHLAEPDAGLRALRSALKAHGAIYAMVYAPYGRRGVYMMQEYCRRLGIGTAAEDLDELAAMIKTLPQHHPLAILLRGSRDSAYPGALADALLNPRDRAYSVEQLFAFLERAGCTFGRWYTQAPYLPQCGALKSTPHAKRLSAFSARDQAAVIELWRGTMSSHSFIAYRDDAGEPAKVRFDDDRWRDYVPLRMPWTVCVEDRLPAGAAGVLVSRNHPFPDLILAIDVRERQLVEAIDGRRRIADIVERAGGGAAWPCARALFERLWWYDHVVFDISHVH